MRGELPAGWDADIPSSAGPQGDEDPRGFRKGDERDRAQTSVVDGRFGGFGSLERTPRSKARAILNLPIELRVTLKAQAAAAGVTAGATCTLVFANTGVGLDSETAWPVHGGIIPYGATFLDLLRLHATHRCDSRR